MNNQKNRIADIISGVSVCYIIHSLTLVVTGVHEWSCKAPVSFVMHG